MELVDKIIVFGIPVVLFVVMYLGLVYNAHKKRGLLPFRDYDLP